MLCIPNRPLHILPILPNASVEPVLKTEQNRHAHNADRHGTTDGPEIPLRPVGVDDAFEVHPKVGCEE